MNIALIAITNEGINVAEWIKTKLDGEVTVFLPQKLKQTKLTATYYSKKLSDQIGELFSDYEGFILIMAAGIVVRMIAPYIKDKYTDPAVVVVDDVGRYVISMLSGHEGGGKQFST